MPPKPWAIWFPARCDMDTLTPGPPGNGGKGFGSHVTVTGTTAAAPLATTVPELPSATVVLAVGSYVAYKVRERRHPDTTRATSDEPVFFERFFPGEPVAPANVTSTGTDAAAR